MNQNIKLSQRNIGPLTSLPIKRFYNVKYECPICLEKLLGNEELLRMNCGDAFHKNCIRNQLENAVRVKYQKLLCPSLGCKESLSGSLLPKLGFNQDDIDRYYENQLEQLVINNSNQLSCCPTPGCSNIFKRLDDGVQFFNCEFCQKGYCLKCQSEIHPQFSCEDFQRSRDKKQNEESFQKLMKERNCKQCPKCTAWISKSQGCNHMKCKCSYEFCFKCGKKNKDPSCKCPIFDNDSGMQP